MCVVDICENRVRMVEWACCIGVVSPSVCSVMHDIYPIRTEGVGCTCKSRRMNAGISEDEWGIVVEGRWGALT